MTWNDAQGHIKGHIKNQSHTPVHPWWKESLCWPPFYIFMERQKKNISKKSCFFKLVYRFFGQWSLDVYFWHSLDFKDFQHQSLWQVLECLLFMGSVTFYLQWFLKKQAWTGLRKIHIQEEKKWRILGKSVFRLLLEINSINGAREKQNF